MIVVILIAFSVVFAFGQAAWDDLSIQAKHRQDADDLAGAESLRREALRLAEKQLDPSNKQLARLLADLSFSLHFEARDAEAEPFAQRGVLIAKESGDQRLTGLMLNVLGVVVSGEGQKARAEPVLRRSVALLEEFAGADSLDVARASNNLAMLYLDTHQFARAEKEMMHALPIYEKCLGPDDPEIAMASGNLFTILAAQHRAEEGEPYLRRALVIGERSLSGSLSMANLQLCLAALEASRENLKVAAQLLVKVIAIQERLLGPAHREVGYSLAAYSTVLRRMHQKSEAKIALNRANMILKSALNDVK